MNYIISLLAFVQAFYYLNRISKKTTWVVTLIYFEVIYNLIIKFLIGNTPLPSMFNYLSDVVLIIILMAFFRQSFGKVTGIPRTMLLCGSVLLVVSLVSYAINLYSPLQYLWGFRNNFRFILFAIMCAVYLQKQDIDTIMDILYGFFLTNILVVSYQFFFLPHTRVSFGDFISGLFSNGSVRGGNGSLNWLMCIVCTYQTVKFLNEGKNTKRLMLCWAGALYMAALAEIKLLFIQLVIICALAVVICKKSWRSLVFTLAAILSILLGIQLLYIAFPEFDQFFRWETMLSYVTHQEGYAGKGSAAGLDRLTAIPYVLKNFLPNWSEKLFGIGLGNADYSSYSFLVSSFYRANSWTGYIFFSSSFITVELGIIGFAVYLMWFLNDIRKAVTVSVQTDQEKSAKDMAAIIGLIAIMTIFSNQTMKLEASAYMVNCVLTFPFILAKTVPGQAGKPRVPTIGARIGKNTQLLG